MYVDIVSPRLCLLTKGIYVIYLGTNVQRSFEISPRLRTTKNTGTELGVCVEN